MYPSQPSTNNPQSNKIKIDKLENTQKFSKFVQ